MPKDPLETVKVIEPPIEALTKKHSSLKRTCLTGCGCIVIFIIAIVVGLWLFIGSGPSTLKTVPASFPSDITVYDKDNIDTITFIPGKYKSRGLQISALVPKIILSPLLLSTNNSASSTENPSIWDLITSPVTDTRDTVNIEWRGDDAPPKFFADFYTESLLKAGYTITDQDNEDSSYSFTFNKGDVTGSFVAESADAKETGTDYARLSVDYYSTTKN